MTTEIKEYSAIDKGIGAMTRKYKIVPGCETKDGFEDCKKQHREIRKVYTALENKRKELKAPLVDQAKLLDSEAKAIVGRLDVISIPFKDAIDNRKEELATIEAKRVADLNAEIEGMKAFVSEAIGKTSTQIAEIIEAVDLIEVDEHFEEFQSDARETLIYTKTKLAEMLSASIQRELSDKETAEANKKADAAEEENRKLREQIAAMQKANETPNTEENDTIPTVSEETETVELSLTVVFNEWASAWGIDPVALQELSMILKNRGLIT